MIMMMVDESDSVGDIVMLYETGRLYGWVDMCYVCSM